MSVRLFVGNLSYEATEEEIREHFSPVGKVLSVFLPVDRETGRKRGFAFVELEDSQQVQEAIRLFNNQPFKGRPLAVNEARAKESRPAGARPGMAAAPRRGPDRVGRPAFPSEEELANAPRADRQNRRFGPDSKPARSRTQRANKSDNSRRPFKEKFTGQVFGLDDDDHSDVDLGTDDFATGLDSSTRSGER